MVEAVYAGGVSPGTFSNDVVWDPSTAVMNPEEFDGRFDLFPVPATEYFNVVIDPSEWQDITIAIFDANGRQIDYYTFGKTELVNISRKTSDLATGSYVLVAYVGGKVMTKQLIIAD